ncbi:MAG: sulfite exporter TauE/SafE family protein [Lachnospiraceae bacterium]|nr:sulfite exporter TauE/SafE family protein [Lachnospiraceae bacterium]
MSKKVHFDIGGMSCIHCEKTIEKALKAEKGVLGASTSYEKGTADITYNENLISEKQIVRIIESLDYKVLSGKSENGSALKSAGILLVIVALFYLLQVTGILNYMVPGKPAETGMGYGMLFVIGLITSIHCVAMCGGIALSQSLSGSKASKGTTSNGKNFYPSLAYNLGRVCSYTAIGFALGLVGMIVGGGKEVGISYSLQGILKIIAGLLMVIMGINMLGIFPGLRKLTIHPPKALTKFISTKSGSSKRPFIVDFLNGFMPCGPLQSMWIVALATGNPFGGALSMFLFSLGTLPLMLGLGSFVSALGKKFTKQVMAVGAVLVAVLGLSMLSQGITISRWHEEVLTETQATAEAVPIAAQAETEATTEQATTDRETIQEISSTLTLGTYPEITVKAGVPVKWTILAEKGTLTNCNYKMIIPDYGIEHTFDFGENVIEFTPEETGVVNYSCWMGMIRGRINVVD